MLVTFGLIVIAIAWMVQISASWKGRKEMKKEFLLLYMLGVMLIILDAVIESGFEDALYQLVTLLAAALGFVKISGK